MPKRPPPPVRVKVSLGSLDIDNCRLDSIQAAITAKEAKAANEGITDLFVEMEELQYDDSGTKYAQVYGYRDENDAEKEARLIKKGKAQEAQRLKDEAALVTLAAKLGRKVV